MSGLVISCVSPLQIFDDLKDCVTSSSTKVQKRLNRLRVLCILLKIDPDVFISHLKVCEEKNINPSIESIKKFINRPLPNNSSEIIIFDKEPVDDSIKKLLESILTSKLNSDLMLYKITCGIVRRLMNSANRHSILGPLIKRKQLILVHKGGVAQRLVLLNKYPEHEEIIKQAFNLGGDNDTNIYIDPNIDNYEEIHKLTTDFVWDFLLKNINRFTQGTVNKYADNIKEIMILGESFPVKSVFRNNFRINTANDICEQQHMIIQGSKQGVFATRNDTLEFKDEVGRLCKFSLLRYKKAFQIGERILGAEILDISIPHRAEEKSAIVFHQYKNGNYIKEIYLSHKS